MQLTWDEICADRSLQDLPYKIETNRHGQIVMSPAKFWHSSRQGKIAHLLGNLGREGMISTETAIQTSDGVKVADVAWSSREFFEAHRNDSALTVSPELCVEVISGSNTTMEIREKIVLYFAHGAKEVWLCDDDGKMTFYVAPEQTAERSRKFPGFPTQI